MQQLQAQNATWHSLSWHAAPGSDCQDPSTAPVADPLCPCTPQEFPVTGACPQGFQCAGASAQGVPGLFLCQPCVYGQYCPMGSFQPTHGVELLQYVERYSCRCASADLGGTA